MEQTKYITFVEEKAKVPTNFDEMKERETVLETLDTFRNDYADFYAGRGEMASHVGCNYWHTMKLKRRRLDAFGMVINVNMQYRNFNEDEPAVIYWQEDVRQMLAEVKKPMVSRRTFRIGERKLRTENTREIGRYVLSKPLVNGRTYVCPACGNEANESQLLHACPHCNSSFTKEDLQWKVASFVVQESPVDAFSRLNDKALNGLVATAIIGGLVGLITPIYSWFAAGQVGTIPILPALLGVLIGVLAGAVVFRTAYTVYHIALAGMQAADRKEKIAQRKTTAGRFERQAKAHDPNFSVSAFLGNIENKLLSIHYAHSLQDVKTFVSADIESALPAYQNIVECFFEEAITEGYKIVQNKQVATVKVFLKLLCLEDGKLKEYRETVHLQLEKDKDCLLQEVCIEDVLTCSNCGHAMQLKDGGVCPHCGGNANVAGFDWVVTAYKTDGMKSL